MEIKNTRTRLDVDNADIAESRFSNANLAKSSFNDVNLQRSVFTNTNLADASFADMDLSNAALKDVNLSGATINGVLITDLIRAYEHPSEAVIYAKSLDRVQAFYQGVLAFEIRHTQPDHVLLTSSAWRLTIVKIPESVATSIAIAAPPTRRSQAAIKLVFEVADLPAARERAQTLGGELSSEASEWIYQGYRICDGLDPEGNVLQFRQVAPTGL
jgi:uncharacterized protein YjbI with pentapeptide repeats